MYTITQIEDAIIARLQAQLTYLRTCASLGEFLKSNTEDLTLLVPAAWVVYQEGKYAAERKIAEREMTFAVICMARNLRGDEAARRGQGTETGAYQIMEDAREALRDQNLGLDLEPLIPIDETAIEGSVDRASYGIRFRTRCWGYP